MSTASREGGGVAAMGKKASVPVPEARRKTLAIHLHLFHLDQLGALLGKLGALGLKEGEGELFVTLPDTVACEEPALRRRIRNVCPTLPLFLWRVPNVGYDIGGFIDALRHIDLGRFRFLLKLHTKGRRDTQLTRLNGHYLNDAVWWDALVESLVDSREAFARNLAALERDPRVGMLGSALCLTYDANRCEWALPRLNAAFRAMGLRELSRFGFVAGTMFLTRAELMVPLRAYAIDDFSPPSGDTKDHTLAHLLERACGAAVEAQGYALRPIPHPRFRGRLFLIACGRLPKAAVRRARRLWDWTAGQTRGADAKERYSP